MQVVDEHQVDLLHPQPVEGFPQPRLGDLVIGTLRGTGGPDVLLVGHMDTVFDAGTASVRPFRTEEGRAYGPGTYIYYGGCGGPDDQSKIIPGETYSFIPSGYWGPAIFPARAIASLVFATTLVADSIEAVLAA